MRVFVLGAGATAAILAGIVSLGLTTTDASAYGGGKCLKFRDLQSLTKVDDRTLLARSRFSQKYTVKLRSSCRDFGTPGNFYTVRLYSNSECFDRDDVLVFRYGGSCFIENVTPLPPGA